METSLCMLSLLTSILGEINSNALLPIYNPLISVSSPCTFQALHQGCISPSWLPMYTGIYQFQIQFKHQLILKLFLRSLPGRNTSQNTDSTLLSLYHLILSIKAIFLVFYSIIIIPLKAASGPYSPSYSFQHPTVGFNYFLSEKFKCSLILITSYNSL